MEVEAVAVAAEAESYFIFRCNYKRIFIIIRSY